MTESHQACLLFHSIFYVNIRIGNTRWSPVLLMGGLAVPYFVFVTILMNVNCGPIIMEVMFCFFNVTFSIVLHNFLPLVMLNNYMI